MPEPSRGSPSGGSPSAGTDLAAVAALFVGRLHAAGLPVGPERAGRFASAVATGAPAALTELYWLARVTLVSDPEHVAAFDAVFDAVFRRLASVADNFGAGNADVPRPSDVPRPEALVEPSPSGSAKQPSGGQPADSAASDAERLSETDFADLTPEELAALAPLFRQLLLRPPLRAARRRRIHPRGDRVDLRASARRSRRTAGDLHRLVRQARRRKPRRLVALLDVSGSMEPYARAYLQLLWVAASSVQAETFVFATRLTRLTRALAAGRPDTALSVAVRRAPDFSGGTRIGASVKGFLDRHGRRGMARGAVLLVLSDGWERDDPAALARQMAALSRLAHRIVWVNPRVAAPGFEPVAGGMAAALPYIDALLSGHSLAAMREVVAEISAPAPRSPAPRSPAQRSPAPL